MTSVREEIGWVDGSSIYGMLDFKKRLENAISAMKSALGLMRKSVDSGGDPAKGLRLFSESKELIMQLLKEHSLAINYRLNDNFILLNDWLRCNGSFKNIKIYDGYVVVIERDKSKNTIDLFDISNISEPRYVFEVEDELQI